VEKEVIEGFERMKAVSKERVEKGMCRWKLLR
jgi:hypothetical protein